MDYEWRDAFGNMDMTVYKKNEYKWVTSVIEKLLNRVNPQYQYMNHKWFSESSDFTEKDPIFVQKVTVPNPEKAKIIMIGDLHSSLTSMINILKTLYIKNMINLKFHLADDHYLVFLGDIIDRGPYGIELMAIALTLKYYNPDNVFIINGNHEDFNVYKKYGFLNELKESLDDNLVKKVNEFMWKLPSAIILEIGNNKYQLCHGAVASKEHQRELVKFINDSESDLVHLGYRYLLHDDLKWGDFTGYPGFEKDHHGRNRYGPDVVEKYLKLTGLTCILSGHQDNSNLLLQVLQKSSSVRLSTNYSNYKLYVPKTYDHISKNDQRSKILLRPMVDFQALVTSSAYMSKKNSELKYDTFLLLEPSS